MNKKLIAAVGASIAVLSVVFVMSQSGTESRHAEGLGFTYDDANSQLKATLDSQNIMMSSPLKISGESVDKYCKFFQEESKQELIKYCTSTELKSSDGKFLGNIHIVGSEESPELVIGIIQADPFMSQSSEIKTVFLSIIKDLVCDCWGQYKPDNFTTPSMWIDAMSDFHISSGKPTTKSKLVLLDEKYLQLEVTTNKDGYLWKLFVTK